ncbi:MAG TPA: very short patch repair endonuclease [Candidatus Acidoferrales bacterium]|nr:very short patch repair endonuclease [Candidatus Acidoferrales bacterium]
MESPEVRRRTMQAVKSKNTAPELLVRSLTHRMGYRFRLHRKDLPGKPDLVFPGRRKAIFVHGCFWHGHDCARGARVPKVNRDYWLKKINRNRERDQASCARLTALGWKIKVLWECELGDQKSLRRELRHFLS